MKLRQLAKALIEKVNAEQAKKDGDLLPGGDIRIRGNQWVRSAFVSSGLEKVPRERQVREAIRRLVKKKHLSTILSFHFFNGNAQIIDHCYSQN